MLLRTLAFALAAALISTAPCGAATLYFSATGTGATCTATSPCSNWLYVDLVSQAGDTVVCLSPPTGNSITISKPISIDCSGAGGEVRDGALTVPGPFRVGIVINTTGTVRIRGLTIDGVRTTSTANYDRGIDIQYADAVYIEDCVIMNVNQQGIYDRRIGGQTKLFVKNTVVSGAGGPGIVAASGAPGVMVLDNVSLLNNTYGLATASGNNVTLKNSTISGNSQAGVEADGGAQVTVENSTITNNNIGVLVGGTVRLLRNNISFNNQAVNGSAISAGGNLFSGNAAIGNAPSLATGAQADVYN
jgi:hypothetical protein